MFIDLCTLGLVIFIAYRQLNQEEKKTLQRMEKRFSKKKAFVVADKTIPPMSKMIDKINKL